MEGGNAVDDGSFERGSQPLEFADALFEGVLETLFFLG
ncbi:hypothetical protein SDC9_95365 [bioreactor metagenome]|uniref:Uncharacterized protein n=1 Tax=bioreactor metagenome TaxID=1076179 RepID=A0A645A650_9ZZZZ